MSVPIWSRFTRGDSATTPGRPPASRGNRRQPTSRSPRLEVLEDRLLPSGTAAAGLGPPLAPEKPAEQPPAALSVPASAPPPFAVVGTGPAAPSPDGQGPTDVSRTSGPEGGAPPGIRTWAETRTVGDVQAQPDFQSRLDSFTAPAGPPQPSATPLPLQESSLAVVATLLTDRGESGAPPERRSAGAGSVPSAERAGTGLAAEAWVPPPSLPTDAAEAPAQNPAAGPERPAGVPDPPPSGPAPLLAPAVVTPGQLPPGASPPLPRPASPPLAPLVPVNDAGPVPPAAATGGGQPAAPAEATGAAEPAGGGAPVERADPASLRDAAFVSPPAELSAPAPRAWLTPAARVASEFVLAAVFAAGVTHPWWSAGSAEPNRTPARGRRRANEV